MLPPRCATRKNFALLAYFPFAYTFQKAILSLLFFRLMLIHAIFVGIELEDRQMQQVDIAIRLNN